MSATDHTSPAPNSSELQATLQALQRAQQVAHLGSWHLDLKRNGLTWSDETYRIFGVTDNRPLTYEAFLEQVHPDDRDLVHNAWQAALQGAVYDVTHRIMVQGEVRWVRELADLIFAPDGSLLSGVGTVHDITEQKLSQMQYETIIDTTRDGFWIVDDMGRFLEVNNAYSRMIGYSKDELLRMGITDVEARERPEETRDRIRQLQEVGYALFETAHRCKDGSLLELEISVTCLPSGNGRMTAFLRDIGGRKQAETAMRQARLAAEEANRAKSEFLANMSHEIRTPMNAIMGLIRLVLDSDLSTRQQDFLRKAYDASRSLLAILNDILDYSKIEAGRLELNCQPCSVEDTLQRTADLFAPQLAEKGLELLIEIASDLPEMIITDQMRLLQVLNNLVSNAVKFTAAGEIHLTVEKLRQDGDRLQLRFTVRDTGIGLSKAQAERLFQPFTQADSSITRRYGGTGLGLAISRSLVELLGGAITVSSSEGAGATFSFTVEAVTAVAPHPRVLQQMDRLKVLVADDNPTSRIIISQLLQRWGQQVEVAASGEQALTLIRQAAEHGSPFDLLLADWPMPGMDGLQLLRAVQQDQAGGDLPRCLQVVMVTGYDREALLTAATELPLDGILQKPVVPTGLFDLLIGTRQPGLPGALQAAGSLLPTKPHDCRQTASPDDYASLCPLLLRLQDYLEEHELIPESLMQELEHAAAADPADRALARLQQQILLFDHREALATLATLLADLNCGIRP